MQGRQLLGIIVATACTTACSAQQTNQAQQQVTDAYLATAVAAKLATVDADSTTAVKISVRQGVVTLRGQARSASEAVQYAQTARSVNGVKSVVSGVRVNPNLRGVRQSASDAALTVRVSAAIAAQAGVNVFHVSPGVRDGVVTLTGDVPSASTEQTIVKTVSSFSGVKRVLNRMRVSTP